MSERGRKRQGSSPARAIRKDRGILVRGRVFGIGGPKAELHHVTSHSSSAGSQSQSVNLDDTKHDALDIAHLAATTAMGPLPLPENIYQLHWSRPDGL